MTLLMIDINMPTTEFDYLEAAEAELISWEAGEIKNKDLSTERKAELRKLRKYIDEKRIGSRIFKHLAFDYKGVEHRGYTISDTVSGSGKDAGKTRAEAILAKLQEYCAGAFIWQAWRPDGHVGTKRKTVEKPAKVKVDVDKDGEPVVRVIPSFTISVYRGAPEWTPPVEPHPGYISKSQERATKDENGDEKGTETVTVTSGSMSWRGKIIKEAPPRA